MRLTSLSAALLIPALAAGCSLYTSSDDDDDDPPPAHVETQIFPTGPLNRDLDLLFVIDNSGSMGEEQNNIASGFAQFVNVLATIEGGLPNVHVGVVSTNMGTGGVNIGGCSTATSPLGDNGALRTNDCSGLTGSFISDVAQPDGTRSRNYSGDLSAMFSCMARLGTGGCGFEQPLESMFTALSPGRNPGFLRPDARLAIVFLGDEDDCSALPGGAMFGDPQATITSPLGPRTSFRCFEFGVQCDDDPDPRAFGDRTGCVPRTGSPFMQPVTRYIDFVRGLKSSANDVFVAGIIGSTGDQRNASVVPDPDDATRPRLAESCTSSAGVAFPGFRLQSFLEGFPHRHASASICSDNLAEPLTVIADDLRTTIGAPCFQHVLADVDPAQPGLQAECAVIEFIEVGGVRSNEAVVPACGAGPGACWRVVEDPVACQASGLTMRIENRTAPTAPNAFIEARCVIP